MALQRTDKGKNWLRHFSYEFGRNEKQTYLLFKWWRKEKSNNSRYYCSWNRNNIFDEPTASLDPANIEKFKNTINKLDKTIVISTHDIDFAYEWADRFIIFNNGNIIADGDYAILKKWYNRKSEFKETYTLADYGGNGL